MGRRKRHPNKVVEQAIRYAEEARWHLAPAGKSAHAWGVLTCPNNDVDCRCGTFCRNSVWSTPRHPESHARQIKQWVDNCIYRGKQDG